MATRAGVEGKGGGKWRRRWRIGRVGGVGEGRRVGVVQGAPSAVGAGVLGAAGVVRRVLLNAAWCPKNLCARTTQPRRERGGRGRNGGGGGRGRGGARGGAEARGRGRASHRGEKMAVSRSRRLPTSKRGRGEGHGKQGGRGGGRGLRVGKRAGRCWSRGRGGLGSRTPCRRRLREVLYDDVSPPKRWSRRRAATGVGPRPLAAVGPPGGLRRRLERATGGEKPLPREGDESGEKSEGRGLRGLCAARGLGCADRLLTHATKNLDPPRPGALRVEKKRPAPGRS